MAQTIARVRAPALRGDGGWINTREPLRLEDLHGRVVILDFWTFCCINCLRVIEELRPIEQRFGADVVVIGVHSPKFPHEADHDAVVGAVRRHRIEHPVLDDPGLETWQRYGVRAWPTLVIIDRDGYIAGVASGEGNGPAVAELVARLLEGSDPHADGAIAAPPPPAGGPLLYPGKVAANHDGSLLAVADTGHDRVLLVTPSGEVRRVLGGLHQPQGVRFDGDRLVVCDTVAGTLLGMGFDDDRRDILASGLRSPWDVVRLDPTTLVVAEAGTHRLLAVPSQGGAPHAWAGTGVEGLRDGPSLQAHLAQPSGLSVLADGSVAVADSEVSALRVVCDGRIKTLVGRGLFEWGDSDGDRQRARLQHPLGVAALAGGGIAVADTFNSAIRLWRDGELSTLELDSRLAEPGGIDVLPGAARVVVADTNNHRVLVIDLNTGHAEELRIGDEPAPPLAGHSGAQLGLSATVDLDGMALDPASGPPVRLHVGAEPETLLAGGPRDWAFDALPAEVAVTLGAPGTGTLTVDLVAAICHDDVCEVRRRTRRHRLTVS